MLQMWKNKDGSYVSVSKTKKVSAWPSIEPTIKLWSGVIEKSLLGYDEFDINDHFPHLKGTAIPTLWDIPNNKTHFVGKGKLFIEWGKDEGDS